MPKQSSKSMVEEIAKEYYDKMPKYIVRETAKEIPKDASKEIIKRIFEKVYKTYLNSRIEPGDAVGVITAQSFGEPATQMTLNTFHLAGVSEVNVTLGLPRIIEIVDARNTIKVPVMEIYLKEPYNKGKNLKELALRLKETILEDITERFEVDLLNKNVIVYLDKNEIEKRNIHTKDIINGIKKSIKKITVKDEENKIIVSWQKETHELIEVFKLKNKLKHVFISGIKGIKYVLSKKKNNEWYFLSYGSNLKEVLALDFVDPTRTTTNNIYEIAEILGIEAARQAIVIEIKKVLENQGINIDERHLYLVADSMCVSGKILGVTRYGLINEKGGVLARAAFEIPIRHLIEAALSGEENKMTSVLENVMINQQIKIGTGIVNVMFDYDKFKQFYSKLNLKQKN